MAYPKISNLNMWDALRAKFPNFKNHTSEGTKDLFTEKGFEQLLSGDQEQLVNDFFTLSIRVYLQMVNISQAVDRLGESGFGEYFDQPRGGLIQRMAVNSIKPITPAYKNLKNGSSPDPFVVRKPETTERIFQQNFDYASLITIPDEFAMKQIFISEFGISEFMAGIMQGLQNGYIIQLYENKLEALNAGINSTNFPLQGTQKYEVTMSANPSAEELKGFVLAVKNVISAMLIGPQTAAFNALRFASMQSQDRLKLLVRPQYKNLLSVNVLSTLFNADNLNLPIDVIEVPHFGGLTPFSDSTYTTPVYPVYDTFGASIGYNTNPDQNTVNVNADDIFWKDGNADVYAVLADKGYLFHSQQNPYRVEAIRNPRGLYTNYWASSPNNAVCVDHLYNIVVFNAVEPE